MRRVTGRRAVAVLAVLALTVAAGCSDGDDGSAPTRAEAADAVDDGLATEDDLPGSDWSEVDPDDEPGSDLALLRACAPLDALVDDADDLEDGLLDEATSPEYEGEGPDDGSTRLSLRVVTGVAVYEDDTAAADAVALVDDEGEDAFESCVGDTITAEVADLDPDESDGSPGDLDLVGIDADEGVDDLGDESLVLVAEYPEEVLGGYDDSNELDVLVVRTGPALAVVGVVASQQNLDGGEVEDVATEIAEAMVERIDAALA